MYIICHGMYIIGCVRSWRMSQHRASQDTTGSATCALRDKCLQMDIWISAHRASSAPSFLCIAPLSEVAGNAAIFSHLSHLSAACLFAVITGLWVGESGKVQPTCCPSTSSNTSVKYPHSLWCLCLCIHHNCMIEGIVL